MAHRSEFPLASNQRCSRERKVIAAGYTLGNHQPVIFAFNGGALNSWGRLFQSTGGSRAAADAVLPGGYRCREYVSPARDGFHDLLRPIVQGAAQLHHTLDQRVVGYESI